MNHKETQDIKKLLKMLGFERNLNNNNKISYYKFYKITGGKSFLYGAYYDEGLDDFILTKQGDSMVPIRAQDDMIIEILKNDFKDKKDILREWKIDRIL